jgi:hypothetical protein
MKHLKYLVILVLITSVAVSLGFASKAKKGTASTPTPSAQIQGAQLPQLPSSSTLGGEEPQLRNSKGQILNDPEIRRSNIKSSRRTLSPAQMKKTSSPTPIVDKTSGITAQLSGTYHIPGDFPTINAAISVLNFVGVDGPTTFLLDNTTYNLDAGTTFDFWVGGDSFMTTFQPNVGVATTINFKPSASEGKGFAFNGTYRLTIDGVDTGVRACPSSTSAAHSRQAIRSRRRSMLLVGRSSSQLKTAISKA